MKSSDCGDDLPGRQRWKGLRTRGLLIRTREVNGRETDEIQCSISSLKRNVTLFAVIEGSRTLAIGLST